MGETPFSLTYGCEAIILVKVGSGSFRRDHYNPQENKVNHRLYLDTVEETRQDSQASLEAYHQRVARHYKMGQDMPPWGWRASAKEVNLNTKDPGHAVFGEN